MSRRLPAAGAALERLAAARGVALGYTDAWGRRHRTKGHTLLACLRALGEPLDSAADAGEALAARLAAGKSGRREVLVAWDGRLAPGSLGRAGAEAGAGARDGSRVVLQLEAGPGEWHDLGGLAAPDGGAVLPLGVHELRRESSRSAGDSPSPATTLVIAAPSRPPAPAERSWGVAAPTYALVDGRGRPKGDLSSLQALGELVGGWGGRYVVTLPLLAQFPPGGGSPAPPGLPAASPYSPISRMWWDVSFLDLRRLPEVASEAERLGPDATADSPEASDVLSLGAERVASGCAPEGRSAAFARYVAAHPDVERYGEFLARFEIGDGPGDKALRLAARRHVYVQWATDEQLREVAAATGAAGCGLVLDLPVGCRPDGYDTWAHPSSFARGVGIGAPPDRFFVLGQDWGLAPLDPEGDRAGGYPVTRAVLAHGMRHAAMLRIDHVMGFERLWWVPAGMPAADGAYVHYPAEELTALACLEAHRAGASLVGEDLGTVTPTLRRLIGSHGVGGMDVAIFDLESVPGEPPRPRRGSLALIDTHDTATFAGWLAGDDVELRGRLGLAGDCEVAADLVRRAEARRALVERLRGDGRLGAGEKPTDLLAGVLEELGESQAEVVVASLEDLWGERDPQNVPGTTGEHENFSRPMARSLDEVSSDATVTGILGRLDTARRRA